VSKSEASPALLPGAATAFPRFEREDALSDRVASMLLERVMLGELRPGEELPSERDLSEQLGVSRTVVREAIRSLTGKGVIEARVGRKARIGRVGRDQVVESMRLFISGRRVESGGLPYAKVHEVRCMLEVTVAGLAAERATPDDVERLRRAFEEMCAAKGDVKTLAHFDVEFHRILAEMSGNELFLVMLDSIGPVLTEIRERTMGQPGHYSSAVKHHGAILKAIESRDADAARKAMEQHLAESAQIWKDEDI
jgi:GntR family transcriptional regulator, transcriptional repressor for pyruvate dehydrogenase complex